MSVNETLICPHCGKEQYTHEPDDIGTYYCLEECEHCGELFWYSIEVSRSYSVMDYDQNGLVSLGVGRMSGSASMRGCRSLICLCLHTAEKAASA